MEATLVPAALLIPPEAHARRFRRHDAALVIDGYLRRLTAEEARCPSAAGGGRYSGCTATTTCS